VVADFRSWLDRQQASAADVGITRRRFLQITPTALTEHCDLYRRRQEQEWERAAWMVHHIMSAFVGSKHAPSVDRLLGRETDA